MYYVFILFSFTSHIDIVFSRNFFKIYTSQIYIGEASKNININYTKVWAYTKWQLMSSILSMFTQDSKKEQAVTKTGSTTPI